MVLVVVLLDMMGLLVNVQYVHLIAIIVEPVGLRNISPIMQVMCTILHGIL